MQGSKFVGVFSNGPASVSPKAKQTLVVQQGINSVRGDTGRDIIIKNLENGVQPGVTCNESFRP